MGVTEIRPSFTQIIDHNSVNVHRIPTKCGTEIHLNEHFTCTKFQSTCLYFMAGFVKCAKISRRKNEVKNPKLRPLVAWKWLERFSSNLECRLPYLAGTSVANLV